MKIGVIKEIKDNEKRVSLTPAGTEALVRSGHSILIQTGAGLGAGFPDSQYLDAGADMVCAEHAWDTDMVIKVKEPLPQEYAYLKEQLLFTYLHLAGVSEELTHTLIANKTTAIAYETVEDDQGQLPLLAPMSGVAGDMAIAMGNYHLASFNNGKGMMLGSVLGRRYGKVLIIGDGVVGFHAARSAHGMGTQVFLCGRHPKRASRFEKEISDEIRFVLSTPENIAPHLEDADLVVGAVLRRGAKAPYVITEDMVKGMQPGSVIVDVSIDQGGCIETSRPTSHSDPVFERHGVIHYCVTNMPGAYPRSSTMVLTAATLPYVMRLADHGIDALREDQDFSKGINTYGGYIIHKPVADALCLLEAFREFSEIH